MAQQWAGKNVEFVAVSIDERKDDAKIAPMLERLHVTPAADFKVWIGSNSDTVSDFKLGDIVPGTVVIDADGTVIARILGEAATRMSRQQSIGCWTARPAVRHRRW